MLFSKKKKESFKLVEPDFSMAVGIFFKDPELMRRTKSLEPMIESALLYLDAPISDLNKTQVDNRFSALSFVKTQIKAAFEKAVKDGTIPPTTDPTYALFVNHIGMYMVFLHAIELYQAEAAEFYRKNFDSKIPDPPKPIDNITVNTLIKLFLQK